MVQVVNRLSGSDGHAINHLVLIGNFLPRQCGLATYTTDTFEALKAELFPVSTNGTDLRLCLRILRRAIGKRVGCS